MILSAWVASGPAVYCRALRDGGRRIRKWTLPGLRRRSGGDTPSRSRLCRSRWRSQPSAGNRPEVRPAPFFIVLICRGPAGALLAANHRARARASGYSSCARDRENHRPEKALCPLCANICEAGSPSTITAGRGKKYHLDEHKQDKYFFRCVGSLPSSPACSMAAATSASGKVSSKRST